MGYTVNGYGEVKLKGKINKKELRNLLTEIVDEYALEIEYDISSKEIYIWDNSTSWYEEDMMELLNALIPYISSGCIEYRGEDDYIWRYLLVDNKWIEQQGFIYYTIEDMIKKLKSEGYEVK